jgi:hypothetical protein
MQAGRRRKAGDDRIKRARLAAEAKKCRQKRHESQTRQEGRERLERQESTRGTGEAEKGWRNKRRDNQERQVRNLKTRDKQLSSRGEEKARTRGRSARSMQKRHAWQEQAGKEEKLARQQNTKTASCQDGKLARWKESTTARQQDSCCEQIRKHRTSM